MDDLQIRYFMTIKENEKMIKSLFIDNSLDLEQIGQYQVFINNLFENKEIIELISDYEYVSSNCAKIYLTSHKLKKFVENLPYNHFYKVLRMILGTKISNDYKTFKQDMFNVIKYLEKYINIYKLYPIYLKQQKYNNYFLLYDTNITLELKQNKILKYINLIMKNCKQSIIAIEGKCASGKTTLCNFLKNKIKATVINADDFFLPASLKTKERMNEVGGNINYESLNDVLSNIKHGYSFKYLAFSCEKQAYYEKEITKVEDLVIVEGVYSYHQMLRKHYSALFYIESTYQERITRLKNRCNNELYNKFINCFIPLENRYYDNEKIIYLSNFII